MDKNDIIKLSENISGMKKVIKISSLTSKIIKIVTAAVILFTAANSFIMLKKA